MLFKGDLAAGLVDPGLIGKSFVAGLIPLSNPLFGDGFLGLLLDPFGETNNGFFYNFGLRTVFIDDLYSK